MLRDAAKVTGSESEGRVIARVEGQGKFMSTAASPVPVQNSNTLNWLNYIDRRAIPSPHVPVSGEEPEVLAKW